MEHQHFQALTTLQERAESQESNKTKNRQKKKFNSLSLKKEKGTSNTTNNCWVVNLSSHTLTHEQEQVLSKGLNFSPVSHKIPVSQFVSLVEPALSKVTSEVVRSKVRLKISSILSKLYLPSNNMMPSQKRALRELKQDPSLVIF